MNDHRIRHICVPPQTSLLDILRIHSEAVSHQLPTGIALVVDDQGVLQGTVTDGDVRRAILSEGGLGHITAADAMSTKPIAFHEDCSFREILTNLPSELKQRNRKARRFLGKIVLIDDIGRPTGVLDYHQLWEQRIATHRHIVVIGLGYVGITLALVLAEQGFQVTGVDVNSAIVAELNSCRSHVHETGINELLREQLGKNFHVTTEIPDDGDVFIIAVGTPVCTSLDALVPTPTLDYLNHATEEVGKRLKRGSLVILRSTVPPGTTRKTVLPLIESTSGLRAGTEFHLAFAPERTVEGNAISELYVLPQVIGGINDDSVEATAALFRDITMNIIRVESLEAAEMVKLVNNCYRDLVFSFANELTQIGSSFNLDMVEVIRAANQGYPRDPVPLPSPGVGGPCLTKDPYILMYASEQNGSRASLSERGRIINESMHQFVVSSLLSELWHIGKDPSQCTIMICGLAFKGDPETADLRGSSSVAIANLLQSQLGALYGHDPVVSSNDIENLGLQAAVLPDDFGSVDGVMFLNNHRFYRQVDVFSMVRSLRKPAIIYDAWHLFRPDDIITIPKITYMGLGMIRRHDK